MVRENAKMQDIHERTYHAFRDRLEALIVAAWDEDGVKKPASEVRRIAIACNAVIDGLWMEGGALAERFRT